MLRKSVSITLTALALIALPSLVLAGWTRTYGGPSNDRGVRIQETTDGGYIIGGITGSFGAGKSDIWLLKTDSQGDTLWTKTYGGIDYEDAVCIQQTQDGGYIVAAQTFSFTQYGGSDIWVLKTDSLGDTLWTLVYGTETRDLPGYVGERPEGGYVVIGGAMYGTLEDKILFIFVDDQGRLEYVKDYQRDFTCANKLSDSIYLVVSTNDVLQFSSQGDYLTEHEHTSAWMIFWIDKYDNWWKENSYILTGTQYRSEIEAPDLWVSFGDIRDGEAGYVLYGEPYTLEQGFCVRNTPDSGYIVVGMKETEQAGDELWLIKEGSTSWKREYGGPNYDAGVCVDLTSDGGYIITGLTSSFGNGGNDLWLIKTDSNGDTLAVEEPVMDRVGDWQLISPIGQRIVLRYKDCPQGFAIFDASGRKLDEIHSSLTSGTVTWPVTRSSHSPGVYFIAPKDSKAQPAKVIIVR